MTKSYTIDYAKNMIAVTAKFHKAAGIIGTGEYDIMAELRKLGMPISVKAPAKKKNTTVTYAKMKKYISLMDEADKYMAEFEAVIEESKQPTRLTPMSSPGSRRPSLTTASSPSATPT